MTASQAILKGLAQDGGLFMPEYIPALDVPVEELAKMSYQETAYAVMKQFFTDYTEEELKYCISHAYDEKFDTPEIAPVKQVDHAYFLELFQRNTAGTGCFHSLLQKFLYLSLLFFLIKISVSCGYEAAASDSCFDESVSLQILISLLDSDNADMQ